MHEAPWGTSGARAPKTEAQRSPSSRAQRSQRGQVPSASPTHARPTPANHPISRSFEAGSSLNVSPRECPVWYGRYATYSVPCTLKLTPDLFWCQTLRDPVCVLHSPSLYRVILFEWSPEALTRS